MKGAYTMNSNIINMLPAVNDNQNPNLESLDSLDSLDSNQAHALRYAAKGWRVFPCGLDKKPLTAHGFKDASTDPSVIKGWWLQHPDASIGFAVPESMLVLDIDLPEGPETLKKLEAIHGALPATRTQQTGGGGLQYFFKKPEGVKVKNSARKIGPGIDTRSLGGYVILPPSGHPSGGRYHWGDEREMADCPGWILDALSKPKEAPNQGQSQGRQGQGPAGFDGMPTNSYIKAAIADELKTLEAAQEGERNHTLNSAAFSIGRFVGGGELSEQYAATILLDVALTIGLDKKEAEATIKSGLAAGAKKPRMAKAEIEYHPNGTGHICREASKALARSPEAQVYRYGGRMCKIVSRPPATVRQLKAADKGLDYPEMPLITELGAETVCHEVEKVAVLQAENKAGDLKTKPWTPTLMKGLLALTEYHEPNLVGVSEHPYIDSDFTPVTKPGYDQNTGIYKSFNIKLEDIFPDAKEALSFLLNELFADFPFEKKTDRYAAVACLLTGMQRKIIHGGCPGFFMNAPERSSGKSTLAQAISCSLYGRPAAAASYPKDESEMAKYLLSLLREGQSSVLLDNIEAGDVIESAELAKIMTSDAYSNRILNVSRTLTVPSAILLMLTGNNISVSGDFNSRFLEIRLDPKTADPEHRRFSRPDIEDWCIRHREKTLSACMKIIMEGKDYTPQDIPPSRFPSWDKFVRNPLYRVSGVNVAEIFSKNKRSDPKLEGQRAFFEAWHETFKNAPVTAAQVLAACGPGCGNGFSPGTDDGAGADGSSEGLRAAMQDIFGNGLPSTKRVGQMAVRSAGSFLRGLPACRLRDRDGGRAAEQKAMVCCCGELKNQV